MNAAMSQAAVTTVIWGMARTWRVIAARALRLLSQDVAAARQPAPTGLPGRRAGGLDTNRQAMAEQSPLVIGGIARGDQGRAGDRLEPPLLALVHAPRQRPTGWKSSGLSCCAQRCSPRLGEARRAAHRKTPERLEVEDLGVEAARGRSSSRITASVSRPRPRSAPLWRWGRRWRRRARRSGSPRRRGATRGQARRILCRVGASARKVPRLDWIDVAAVAQAQQQDVVRERCGETGQCSAHAGSSAACAAALPPSAGPPATPRPDRPADRKRPITSSLRRNMDEELPLQGLGAGRDVQ